MARGAQIIVSANPQGKFLEGTISDTSKPGTVMEIVPATGFSGGRPSYRATTRTAGAGGPIVVLLPDDKQGGTATTAYVAGTRGFLYAPIAGEELNMLLGDVAGTGDVVTQGDLFGVNNNGKLIADSSYTSAPFQSMETLPALTADKLVWMMYLGNQA